MNQAEQDLLVMAAQQGNHKAFDFLFSHYLTPLCRFAYKLGADADGAQDAVQEAWISMAPSLHRLRDVRAFRSWIFRAVRWKVLQAARQPRLFTVPLDEQITDCVAPETLAETSLADDALSHCLKQLADIDRQALHLFYLEEMKIVEIAITLELPEGTVKSRLNRARRQMKVLLEKHEENHHEH